jgi:hypothetical protein
VAEKDARNARFPYALRIGRSRGDASLRITCVFEENRAMSDLNAFIGQAASSLGLSQDATGSALSGILGLIQKQASSGDASALLQALPGATELLNQGQSASSTGGGMMGSLLGAAGSLLGGKAGSALSVMSIFKEAGMNSSQAGSFTSMFMDFVKENVDGDLVGRLLEQIPELKSMLGS